MRPISKTDWFIRLMIGGPPPITSKLKFAIESHVAQDQKTGGAFFRGMFSCIAIFMTGDVSQEAHETLPERPGMANISATKPVSGVMADR